MSVTGARISKKKPFGVKFMPSNVSGGAWSYPEGRVVRDGTYDWEVTGTMLDVPQKGFDEVRLIVGLLQAYGKVRYRNLKMSEAQASSWTPPRTTSASTVTRCGTSRVCAA